MGWPSVEWGLANISSNELAEWKAYFDLYPWGYEIENYRSGLIATAILNTSQDKRTYQPLEFFEFTKHGKQQSDEEMYLAAQMIANASTPK